ncbi:MAG: transcription termination/antitermination factor NusG [Ignavibacteriae bacterium]|nr:transcription termination/antitermination factor NusG [Ignavibacteriota bacterium]
MGDNTEETLEVTEVAESDPIDSPDENSGNKESDKPAEESAEEEEDENFKWYAVRIISGHENKVKAFLDNEIRNENMGHKIRNVLIPLEKIYEVKGGKKKVKSKNFLPGYILIEADLDDKIRDFISKTPSIINMVGSKSIKGKRLEPISLKSSEVKRIKAILNEEGDDKKLDIQLNVGDPVKVTSGPFNNFSGNILEVNLEKLKVKVMVSIFGRKTPIELELTQIEKEK